MSYFKHHITGPEGDMLDWHVLPLWQREQEFRRIVTEHDPHALDYHGQYAIIWEEPLWYQEQQRAANPSSHTDTYGTMRITRPSPVWLAMAMHGHILPPVEVYWALAHDEAQPGFKRHHRGHLLHDTPAMRPLTEQEAMQYLLMKDVPRRVWDQSIARSNSLQYRFVTIDRIPTDRTHRNAWRIGEVA